MILSKELIDTQIRKLQSNRSEWMILVPRLTALYRANAETCRDQCDEVIEFLNELKELVEPSPTPTVRRR